MGATGTGSALSRSPTVQYCHTDRVTEIASVGPEEYVSFSFFFPFVHCLWIMCYPGATPGRSRRGPSPGEAFHAPAQRGDNRFPWKPAVQRCDYLDTVRRPGNTNKNEVFVVVVVVVQLLYCIEASPRVHRFIGSTRHP